LLMQAQRRVSCKLAQELQAKIAGAGLQLVRPQWISRRSPCR
jgi:hypothetical protein